MYFPLCRCSQSDLKRFKSGKVPLHPPCEAYASTLIKGLVGGGQLSEEEAKAYIQEASSKSL
jgi:histone deacetylase 4/5